MPVKEHHCSQYSDLRVLLENLATEGEETYVFFSSTLDQHGEPKAKLCFEAEDVLMEYSDYLRCRKTIFNLIYFRTDLFDYYKCDSPFSQDEKLRVSSVPTIIKWQGFKRLHGRQCCRIPLLSMLFEDEARSKFTLFKPCSYYSNKKLPDWFDNEEMGGEEVDGEGMGDETIEERTELPVDTVLSEKTIDQKTEQLETPAEIPSS